MKKKYSRSKIHTPTYKESQHEKCYRVNTIGWFLSKTVLLKASIGIIGDLITNDILTKYLNRETSGVFPGVTHTVALHDNNDYKLKKILTDTKEGTYTSSKNTIGNS